MDIWSSLTCQLQPYKSLDTPQTYTVLNTKLHSALYTVLYTGLFFLLKQPQLLLTSKAATKVVETEIHLVGTLFIGMTGLSVGLVSSEGTAPPPWSFIAQNVENLLLHKSVYMGLCFGSYNLYMFALLYQLLLLVVN